MKKTIFLFVIFLGTLLTFAQVPEKMNYQAIIRNPSGQLLNNQNIAMRVSILKGSSSGSVVYSERLTGTTNYNGLITMFVGSGTVLSGAFSTIDWSSGNYYIKTETDPTGGSNYSIEGTSQLLSVPFAMYAKNAGSGSGFTLPYTGTSSADHVIPFRIKNSSGTLNQAGLFENTNPTNTAPALMGTNNSTGSFGVGVEGNAQSNTNGNLSSAVKGYLLGTGTSGAGVYGTSSHATGVYATTTYGKGVYAFTNGTGIAGIFQSLNSDGKALATYGPIQFGSINAAAGKVLTALDINGNATWQDPASAKTMPIKVVYDNYNATDDDYTIKFVIANSVNSSKTLKLPSPVGRSGRIYKIHAKIPLASYVSDDTNYSKLTILDAETGNNILLDELGVTVLANRVFRFQTQYLDEYLQFTSVTVQSDGTSWRVIDDNYRYFRDYWNPPH